MQPQYNLLARAVEWEIVPACLASGWQTDNMAAAGLTLTPEEAQLLDEASEPPRPGLPYGALGQSQRSRRIQGGRS
jgi:hypothetical protein